MDSNDFVSHNIKDGSNPPLRHSMGAAHLCSDFR